jgi:hypothetical protein
MVGTNPIDLLRSMNGLKKALKSDFLLKMSILIRVNYDANLLF